METAIIDKEITIPANEFQNFDHGGNVEIRIPTAWNPQPDKNIYWNCLQFEGIAKILRVGTPKNNMQTILIEKVD